ncbi:purine-binding chemotaxis protein CheW [Leptothermofonsia sichuanensis E412]|jgi:chemotaxis-related protein WspB|uniref:chemotaxis protein CheW n=1 Tax=Leptothermofonsia sichuanensis TaxID=2917832 RepID=UPI001CA79DFD|nr:chemotaxis protein CheW [Leptothermofonsia sichuanensis]QZZ21497.1 purine-binding chemotaxis protein CheW [Leptothermofonsia sichuanensis E412]
MLLLVFYVGKNLYAIETSRVVEVIPRVSYREVHHVPEYVAGVFNYRGSIVPVIDLCRLIRGTPSKGYLSTRVMMVSYPRPDGTPRHIGLMAERVIETLDKAETDFKDVGIQANEAPYLGGIITDKKGMIQRIRLEQLFSDVQHMNLLSAGA